jgi:hypothetical protein
MASHGWLPCITEVPFHMVTLTALSLLCSVVVFSLNELNDYECVIWLRWKAVVGLFELFAKALVLAM